MESLVEKGPSLNLNSNQDGGNLMEQVGPLYPDKTGTYDDRASVIERKIRFKFDLQLHNMKEFCSIMKMVVSKISSLKQDKSIESCELQLRAVPPTGKDKIANLDIFIDGNRFLTESKSPRWDNAFLNAFDNFRNQIDS